jgi:tRNA-dihydrouridine synthase A
LLKDAGELPVSQAELRYQQMFLFETQTRSQKPAGMGLLSVAPMMDYTDRHFRFFLRLLTQHTVLYTEMIPDTAIRYGNRHKFLRYDPTEHPVVLQIGGSDPGALAESAAIGEEYGYDAINLNCGCPSDRVEQGRFGASLMTDLLLVRRAVEAMNRAVKIPVTVKHRIGIRNRDGTGRESYEELKDFISACADGGVRHFIVHARIAILGRLNPVQNRSIPPLQYETVYRLKQDFPELFIEINGGIRSLGEAEHHLKYVDGVMIGRAACDTPFLFAEADERIYGKKNPETAVSGKAVIRSLLPYIHRQMEEGIPVHHILRHAAGLFYGQPGARKFRRRLAEEIFTRRDWKPPALEEAIEELLASLPDQ